MAGALVVPWLALAACSGLGKMYQQVETLVGTNQFGQAADLVGESRDLFDDDDELLFHLERGELLHLAERYGQSNRAFERAKKLSRELFTESISAQAFSLFSNDTVIAYEGENFERALVHLFSALNYTMLGDPGAAAVEARQVDALLAKIQTDSGTASVYKEDAFARYLSALLYEQRGDFDEALVAYRQALAGYEGYKRDYGTRRPKALLPLALAAAERQGPSSVRRMKEQYGRGKPRRLAPGYGEVAVLHYNGWVPRKQSSFFEVSFGRAWVYVGDMQPRGDEAQKVDRAFAGARAVAASKMLRIAFPTYVDVGRQIRRMSVSADGQRAEAQLVEDLGRIARKSLDDRKARIFAKAVARAAVKYALAEGICQVAYSQLDQLPAAIACAAAHAANALSEVADTRSWRTIPDQIWLSLLPLPEGRHDLDLVFTGQGNAVVETQSIEGVEVASGQRTFVIARTTR